MNEILNRLSDWKSVIFLAQFYKEVIEVTDEDTKHLIWMCDQILSFDNFGKANRWLGFIQGVLFARKIFTIDELRKHVKDAIDK